MIQFHENDPSLEQQWRGIILFGRNSASYKFAFAKSLLKFAQSEVTEISLEELAVPFSEELVKHLKAHPTQGTSKSSKFLDACRAYISDEISEARLHETTAKLGFVNVIDAFHNVNGDAIPNPFYIKEYSQSSKKLILSDELFKLKESSQFSNLMPETEARWSLVETAWDMDISPNLIEVHHDNLNQLLYLKPSPMRRVDLSSSRDALNGYQKGKCFYTFSDISIHSENPAFCDVDHFFPHVNKMEHLSNGGADINGVWNLVLCDSSINRHDKSAGLPSLRFLDRLHNRNEFFINSKHPLSETIQNQTGNSESIRRQFLQRQYDIAKSCLTPKWEPKFEFPGTF